MGSRQYLENKNRGGSSGQKGTRYEDYFAVYKLAQLAPHILETGLVVYFTGQILAFVDDLIIDIPSQPLQLTSIATFNSVHLLTAS